MSCWKQPKTPGKVFSSRLSKYRRSWRCGNGERGPILLPPQPYVAVPTSFSLALYSLHLSAPLFPPSLPPYIAYVLSLSALLIHTYAHALAYELTSELSYTNSDTHYPPRFDTLPQYTISTESGHTPYQYRSQRHQNICPSSTEPRAAICGFAFLCECTGKSADKSLAGIRAGEYAASRAIKRYIIAYKAYSVNSCGLPG